MKSIKVWAFSDAPEHLQSISTNGGDEDWLVLIPASIKEKILYYGTPFWIEAMDSCREPRQYENLEGDIIFIGSHA